VRSAAPCICEQRRLRAHQRHGVDGPDDDRGEPDRDDGAAGVGEDGALVLNGVPLGLQLFDELVAAGRGVVVVGLRPEQRQRQPRRVCHHFARNGQRSF
jgi:hypothetical protein